MEQQAQINIQLEKTLPISCDNCQNQTFQEALLLRKISKFLTASEKDSLMPIPTFVCTKCGHVNEEFIPSPLRQTNGE